MLSLTAEHALRAVVYLADHPGAPSTVERISQRTAVPAGSLAKVLQQLHRAGLVSSQRGPNGGFLLARAPGDLTLLDIIATCDGPCQSSHATTPDDALGRCLDEARARVLAVYRGTTIAQFMSDEACAVGTPEVRQPGAHD